MNNITGKELIALGYQPAPWFKTALFYLNTLNTVTESDIKDYCDALVKTTTVETIEPHTVSQPYEIFLDANTPDEKNNYDQIVATMNEVMKTPFAIHGVVMPDACPAGSIGTIPVGGVVAMDGVIVPGMHSADICCSVMATYFQSKLSMKELMDISFNHTHFGYGSNPNELLREQLTLGFEEVIGEKLSKNPITKKYLQKALLDLGTQGDGNHFLFLGTSKQSGDKCLVTHHGSRGFGAKIFKEGQFLAEKYTRKYSPKTPLKNAFIPYDTQEGQDYWEALQLVKEWTHLNHKIIHNSLSFDDTHKVVQNFWNEHNFVFKSTENEKEIFYHAKGATPVGPKVIAGNDSDIRRIIPLNMSEPVLIVVNNLQNRTGFAPHGAGRNFGRSEFQRRGNTVQSLQKEIAHLDVRFYSGIPDVSEYPSAYKNANEVKKQILDYNLCQIVDEIIPYGSIMAGNQEEFWRKK